MLQGLPDPPALHPTLIRDHMTCDANTAGQADPSHPPIPTNSCTKSWQRTGERWRRAAGSLCVRMGLGLLRWKVWRESGVCSAWLSLICSAPALSAAAGRLARSRLWLQCSLPTGSIHGNPLQQISHGDARAKPPVKGLKPYRQCPLWGGRREGEKKKRKKKRKANVRGMMPQFASQLPCSVLSQTVRQLRLTPAALLSVVHLNSIPSGRDHNTA